MGGGGRTFEQIKDGLHTKFESLVGQKFVWFFYYCSKFKKTLLEFNQVLENVLQIYISLNKNSIS